jgi:hypothetical protein
MLARLGNVVYWTTSILTVLIIFPGIPAGLNEFPHQREWIPIGMFTLSASLVWLFGRAFRYVLAGR